MWHHPKFTRVGMAHHQWRRFALFSLTAFQQVLLRWCTPEGFKDIMAQITMIMQVPYPDTRRQLDESENDWIFMVEPMMVDEKEALLVRGAKVTRGWLPSSNDPEPPDSASPCFSFLVKFDPQLMKLYEVDGSYEPSVDFRHSILTELGDLFPRSPMPPPTETSKES